MPFSYAQYAGNGSTTTFSVPFPYLLKAHVKLYTGFNILSGAYATLLVDGVDYTWTSTTQVQTTVAPANGVTLTVLRDTPDSTQLVPWQDGSNLVADDMNIADLQNLYVVQEQQDRNDAGITQSTAAATAATAATTAANTATSTANTALSTANAATSTANTALSTANTASSNASAAVSTANTASSNASAAVTTANAANATAGTASTNASNAVTTANAAAANAATALSTANTAATNATAAVSTANTASSNAAAAVSTANTANTNASNAVTTANTANTNASAAVSTANAASTTATNAATTATTANNKADQAIAAVSNSVNYQLKANVAAIPASPANDTYIEVQDSTGLESFTPLAGKPAGFVGDAGLSVRLRYTTAGTTWNWLNYYANDSDARFLKKTGGTMTGPIVLSGAPTTGLNPATKTYVDGYVSSLQGDIGTVSTAAAGAQSTANTAVANAATAQTTANTAVSNAATAQSAANAAQSTANTAVSNAAAAQSTANTAVTNAATAQATADAALPKAGGTATGNISAPAFIPTSSTAPTNGVYLAAANSVAISTNGSGRLFVDSSGRVGVGTASPNTTLHVNGDVRLGSSSGGLISGGGGNNISFGDAASPITSGTAYQNVSIGYLSLASFTGTGYTANTAVGQATLRYTTSGAYNTALGMSAGTAITTGNQNLCLGKGAGSAITTGSNNVIIGGVAGTAALANTVIVGDGAGNERFRCDSSGRLLVGTSTARSNIAQFADPYFQIEGTYQRTISVVNNENNANASGIAFSKIRGTGIVSSGDISGLISFGGYDGATFRETANIQGVVDGTPGANNMPGRLIFSTTASGASSPTERMTIKNKGTVLLTSVTDDEYSLQVRNNGANGLQYGIYCSTANDQNDTTRAFLACYGSTTQRAVIRSNGGLANYQANNVNLSDINTKKDISPAAGTWDCIKEWEIVNYRYKDQPDDADLNLGVIAQQVAESCPEVITVFEEAKDDQPEKLGVKEQQMYWMAIKALQEAMSRIETLEAEVAALKAA